MTDIVETTAKAVVSAVERIAGHIEHTALRRSAILSERAAAEVYCKLENFQTTGSFKYRGATNRLMTLSEDERGNGCVAASSGNHGAALACAMQMQGVTGVIFVPRQTSEAKMEKIRSFGGDVRIFGTDGLDTELHARDYAIKNGMVYVSPYNDAAVIAGQGSCGVEILTDLSSVDAVFIAVGGGGLIGGVGSYLKTQNPDIKIYGCQPQASPVMSQSVLAGKIVEMPSEPTLSDGTAGGVEANAMTLPLCQTVVDEFVVVSEEQIAAAMRLYMQAEGDNIEGAAGVAIAALLARCDALSGKNVVAVICGGNISEASLDKIRTG